MNQLGPVSISVVCVYNDTAVRRDCLDRSLGRYARGEDCSSRVEYIPVENINGTYKSAGAALNYGALRARNDVVVFVHQDVFLHSIEAVIRAAGEMERGNFGLLGAIGVRGDGGIVGFVRDRTVLLGGPVTEPTDVDSVDEVLFMVPRRLIVREPLTESPDMAWDAYAVEYGLRIRRLGLRVGVAHIPVTHNGMNNGHSGLSLAHAQVAEQYRDMLPIRTTCGVVNRKAVTDSYRLRFASLVPLYRKIVAVLAAVRTIHKFTNVPLIYADTRLEVDEIISHAPGRRMYLFNNTSGKSFTDGDGFLELKRFDRCIILAAGELIELSQILDDCPQSAWLLLTNLTSHDIEKVAPGIARRELSIGFSLSMGFWILIGAELSELPTKLLQRRLSLRRYSRSY